MKVDRHKLLGLTMIILLAYILFVGFFFFQALLSPDVAEKRVLSGEYIQVGHLNYSAKLKPNLIYEKDEINGKEILYSSLLSKMEVIYLYSFLPSPEEMKGNYRITILLTPAKGGWEKELGVYTGFFSESPFEISIPLDWDMILAMWKEIENETKYDFGDPNVKFIANLNLNCSLFGENVKENFVQTSNINYGKVISLSEPDKTKKDAVYTQVSSLNTMSVFGFPIEVKNARLIFGILFLASICLFGSLILIEKGEFVNYLSKNKKRSFEKKFRHRIVNILEIPEHSNAVRVLNLKDLAKLSYELDKPILKTKDNFAVVDGDRIYVHDNDNNIISRKE